ncbi:Uncharacterized protein FWK35_00027258 [Aphis craccivora]|uniref:Uncharacterized protein n=1 Tax=Aphis craccivora TaxID=307492 RepID=A0A6G0VXE3_APHCR|nr:Uncharacterized protein FWK35_00027258 [Aphis craccivora]
MAEDVSLFQTFKLSTSIKESRQKKTRTTTETANQRRRDADLRLQVSSSGELRTKLPLHGSNLQCRLTANDERRSTAANIIRRRRFTDGAVSRSPAPTICVATAQRYKTRVDVQSSNDDPQTVLYPDTQRRLSTWLPLNGIRPVLTCNPTTTTHRRCRVQASGSDYPRGYRSTV